MKKLSQKLVKLLTKKKLKISFVKSEIMNQLSYHVDDSKLKNEGLILNSNLETDIKDTIKLFNYLKQ